MASLTDDNAVLAGIASAHYCDINATLYETDFPLYEAWGDCPKPPKARQAGVGTAGKGGTQTGVGTFFICT